jgi:hypothetical protein
MSGCLIAMLVVGGLCLLVAMVGGLIAYKFATSEEGKKIVNAVASGAQVLQEAQSAPGAADLRALGCRTAMVMDAAKFAEIANQFDASVTTNGVRLIVTCDTSGTSKTLTCEQVAQGYVKAVGRAAGPFEVNLSTSHPKGDCEEVFDAEGKKVGGAR